MKHFGRWMICLGLFLNPCLFIALIATGAALNTTLLAIAIACYPFALGLIALARKYINSKCRFYRDSDSFWGKVLKTIFMPIVAAGALIMFHLLTTTYRKMNEDIEDKTGFSVSSIFRTLIGLILYFVAFLIAYLIIESSFNSEAASNAGGGILLFGGFVWLTSHILWDILDFAHKEGKGFILFKNVSFLTIGVLAFLLGIILFFAAGQFETNSAANMFGLTGLVSAPVCISFAYYGIIRTGQVPQSKLNYFWGPIAVAATLLYSFLISTIATNGSAWILVFHAVVFLAYGAVVFFAGLPFVPTDGEYRIVYREIAKEKRIAKAKAAAASNYTYTPKTSPDSDPRTDYQVWDAATKVASKYGYGTSIHISASASINSINLYCNSATADEITYSLYGTLYIDFRGMDPTSVELFLSHTVDMAKNKLENLTNEIMNRTAKALASKGVDGSGIQVTIEPEISENFVYD